MALASHDDIAVKSRRLIVFYCDRLVEGIADAPEGIAFIQTRIIGIFSGFSAMPMAGFTYASITFPRLKMTQQAQTSQNLFEPIKPPKISDNLLPVLNDILQPPTNRFLGWTEEI